MLRNSVIVPMQSPAKALAGLSGNYNVSTERTRIMDLYEAIKHRYSVRAYMDKPVESDKLDRILEAGRLAPSANNRQSWKFVVARNAKLRSALAEACEQPFLAKAPVIVAVVGLDPERK